MIMQFTQMNLAISSESLELLLRGTTLCNEELMLAKKNGWFENVICLIIFTLGSFTKSEVLFVFKVYPPQSIISVKFEVWQAGRYGL